jgi:hypothetical protein
VSFIPPLVQRLSKTHVPRVLEFAFVLGMALQFISESLKLFEIFTYWDKIVHPTLVALTAIIATWLLVGYRDAFDKRLPPHLIAAVAMLLGIAVGGFWEFFELGSDWFGDANLQKSNADTLTDIIANNLGAIVATLLGLWIASHRLAPGQRQEMGQIARWLAHGPSRLLDRHGRLIGAGLALIFGGVLAASQAIDRGTPTLAAGLASGQSAEWNFVGGPPPGQVLAGEWLPDERGVCRQNLQGVRPGSEKMGLLELAPGSVYGADGQPFTLETRYFEERPPFGRGTQMVAGLAFGIRDDKNFVLLEVSALHDVIRLDRYVNGKRRDIRERELRTHGNDWHVLQVTVAGSSVTAGLDRQESFWAADVPETAGGVGLWARTSAASCFSDARVAVGTLLTEAMVPVPGQ